MPIPDGERLFIGDGGLEPTLIFREGFELPEFAAFTLLAEPAGRGALRRYYGDFIEIARAHGTGFTLDTPTWRASAGWGEKLGYSAAAIADVNRDAVELANEVPPRARPRCRRSRALPRTPDRGLRRGGRRHGRRLHPHLRRGGRRHGGATSLRSAMPGLVDGHDGTANRVFAHDRELVKRCDARFRSLTASPQRSIGAWGREERER